MDLQNTFYALGIVMMSLTLIILIALAILVFYIWRKISKIQQQIEEKIEEVTEHPMEMGAKLLKSAIKKFS